MDITVDTGVLVKAMDPMNDIKECAVCVEVLVKILTKCDNLIVSDAVKDEYYKRFKMLERVKLYFNVPKHLAELDIQGKLKYVETFDVNESNIDPDDVKFIETCLRGTSQIIISIDSDFLDNKDYLEEKYQIKVLSPEEY